jgi:hypothetical protein
VVQSWANGSTGRSGALHHVPVGWSLSDQKIDIDDELDDDELEEDGADDPPWLLRLVLESELAASGRATPTGIHLALFGPACAGLDAWELGELWGYSPPELEALRLAGDHLVAVMQSPGERWGRATAETVASLAASLRADAVSNEKPEVLARAVLSSPMEAEQRGLRKLQRQVGAVFGLRDGVFGSGRLPRRGEEAPDLGFYLDEKLLSPEVNGLLPGSSLAVADYPEMATVVRLPWGDDEGTGDDAADDEEDAS